MTASLSGLMQQIEENWREVDVLLSCAETYEESDLKLYDALCRSIAILIVAHMEGFTKELVKAIISDFNQHLTFERLPAAVQRTYCKKYLGTNLDSTDKSHEKKLINLIDKFSEMRCAISHEPFYFPVNKNPNPEILDLVFENFGIKNVFSYFHESSLNQVFSETKSEIEERITTHKNYIATALSSFPYGCNFQRLGFNTSSPGRNTISMWQEFLGDTNRKRHSVAHGNEFENTETVSILRTRKSRIQILQYGLVELISAHIASKIVNI